MYVLATLHMKASIEEGAVPQRFISMDLNNFSKVETRAWLTITGHATTLTFGTMRAELLDHGAS